MSLKKVVVTGMGVISPCGNNVDEYWNNVVNGHSGISYITRFDASELPSRIAGEVRNFNALDYMDAKVFKRHDCFVHYAIAASYQALMSTGLTREKLSRMDMDRIGVIIGTGIGGINAHEKNTLNLDRGNWKKVSPFFIPAIITNMASGLVAIEWGFLGPNFSISTACATSNHSILESMHVIKRGEADIMLTGGTEGALSLLSMSGFCVSKALSRRNDQPTKASRPFDRDRDGFVFSEGAGVLILESEESAIKRNAKIYAEIMGGGSSCDAYHITAPREDARGVMNCMNMAIKNAGINILDVDYVNTHGTSTQLGDFYEQLAIKKIFKDYAYKLKINSTKSIVGHMLGAAGSVEAISVIKSFEFNKLHPTINLDNQDEKLDLDCVANKAIDFESNISISNSFGFGGHNCSIIFKRYGK